MFGIPKREPDVREWLVCAIDPLHTSNREIRGDLVLLPCTARRGEAFELQGAVLHGNRSLVLLVIGVQYSNRVAVQLLYKGNDENASSRL